MRIVCPHVGPIAPETAAALNASGLPREAADVSATPTSYTALLACLWAAGEAFAVVEHDIAPHPGALAELEACPEPWCAYGYRLGSIVHAGLGCARFSTALLAAVPDAVEQTWRESTDIHPAGHWCAADDRLARVLRRAGFAQHVHGPQVRHLNPMPSHGCTTLGGPA